MPFTMSPSRLLSLMRKERLQIVRDPAALLIACAMPVVLLFLFACAVSLDLKHIRIAVVETSDTATGQSLAAAFAATNAFSVTPMRNVQAAKAAVIAGEQRAVVVIPADLERRLAFLSDAAVQEPLVQILPDATQPNSAHFIVAYGHSLVAQWLAAEGYGETARIQTEPRVWYNPEVVSARFLVPGAIAIVMTMIGTMLTALVVVREWERGTMEALLSTPARLGEILLGKLLPYFALGMIAVVIAALLAVFAFDVPLRGSPFALLLLSATFLVPALGQGLLISIVAKNQFVAAQMAVFSGFLPAFLLSGFLFEIDAMPAFLQGLTRLIPARYFVETLQTVFLSGDVWPLFLPNMAAMLALGTVFFALARGKMHKSLERTG